MVLPSGRPHHSMQRLISVDTRIRDRGELGAGPRQWIGTAHSFDQAGGSLLAFVRAFASPVRWSTGTDGPPGESGTCGSSDSFGDGLTGSVGFSTGSAFIRPYCSRAPSQSQQHLCRPNRDLWPSAPDRRPSFPPREHLPLSDQSALLLLVRCLVSRSCVRLTQIVSRRTGRLRWGRPRETQSRPGAASRDVVVRLGAACDGRHFLR